MKREKILFTFQIDQTFRIGKLNKSDAESEFNSTRTDLRDVNEQFQRSIQTANAKQILSDLR